MSRPRSTEPPRYTVVWSDPALVDLDEIETFVALDAPSYAPRLRHEIVEGGNGLREFPLRNQVLLGSVRRLVIADRYLLRYRVAGSQVRILGVRDARRR